MKIYDCFTFFNELDLLELRFNLLYDSVDYFVLTESTRTFTNKEKSLYFWDNKDRYMRWADKIRYVRVDTFPQEGDSWSFESNLRNSLFVGINDAVGDDLILLSDVDEMPKPECISLAKDHRYFLFIYDMFYYYFNCLQQTNWSGTFAFKRNSFINSMEYMRQQREALTGGNNRRSSSGWHFSYMGGIKKIQEKIATGGHQEDSVQKYNIAEHIQSVMEQGKDLFNRGCYNYSMTDKNYLGNQVILDFLQKYPQYYKES